MIEKEKIVSDDKQIAKIFNDYFISIPILNMPTNQEFECSVTQEEDPLLRIIEKYRNHPSVKLIKSKNGLRTFRFRETLTRLKGILRVLILKKHLKKVI